MFLPPVYIPTAFAKSLGIPRKFSGVAHPIAESSTPVILSGDYSKYCPDFLSIFEINWV
jgi:hypothetical protein